MSVVERIQAAVIDGRARNIRYRQKHLLNLHTALREQAGEITSAIAQDSGATSGEAEAEFYLALSELKFFYDSLDLKEDLKQEYSIAHGADNAERRKPVGLVVIRPTTHTRFFSILVPLAAALAAGNCVILEIWSTKLTIDSLLTKLLLSVLDNDAFGIVSKPLSEEELSHAVLVDETSTSTSVFAKSNQLLSSTQARCVAIVDRTADIELAAKAIVNARFGFGGFSPYAPDLVLVNDFFKAKFFEACTKFATQAFTVHVSKDKKGSALADAVDATKKSLKEAEAKGKLRSFGNEDVLLLDILDRDIALTQAKVSGRYLAVASTSSITDAVFSQPPGTLLAGYFFADAKAAKFISQHVDCQVSYVNQIPTHLLVGPAAPLTQTPSLHHRYTPAMFTLPRPEYISTPSPELARVDKLVVDGDASVAKALRAEAVQPLKPFKQGLGHAIGFFEQGILTGLGITASIVLPTVAYGLYFVGKKGFEFVKNSRT